MTTAQSSKVSQVEVLYKKIAKAYKVACPIVSLSTSDPAHAIEQMRLTFARDVKHPVAFLQWDAARGFTVVAKQPEPLSQKASKLAEAAGGEILSLSMALTDLCRVKDGAGETVCVIHNAHRFLDDAGVVQALWNIRDVFKVQKRMIVLLGTSIAIPAELQNDIIALDEPLPTREELLNVVTRIARDAELDVTDEVLVDAAAASQGMSAFGAEQLAALNCSLEGLSVRGVWGDKCAKVDETPGLKVVHSPGFEAIAGMDQIKGFLSGILNGREKPRTVVYIDEIEKSIGGAGSDSSGVAQDQLGCMLQYMQDKRASGALFLGHPGVCKSAIAKATGAHGGIPTIQFDLGAMKGSLVGSSEARIRDALKVIDAVSGGETLWLATCNNLTSLPPELRRRFKLGTWFFDLPTYEERVAIWDLYARKYEHEMPSQQLLSECWTGAEIESCCEVAWRMKITPDEAQAYIVPISRSSDAQIKALQSFADGKFLNASKPGVYTKPLQVDNVSTVRQFS